MDNPLLKKMRIFLAQNNNRVGMKAINILKMLIFGEGWLVGLPGYKQMIGFGSSSDYSRIKVCRNVGLFS